MDIPLLAQTVADILKPALQLLLHGEGFGISENIRVLWKKLWPQVESRPKARAAVEDLATRPNDDSALEVFAEQLTEILNADLDLATEVAEFLDTNLPREASNSEVTRERGIDALYSQLRALESRFPPDPDIRREINDLRERLHKLQQQEAHEIERRFERARLDRARFERERLLERAWNRGRLSPAHEETVRLPPSPAPLQQATEVRFTTYTPAAVPSETWATLLAYCHLPGAAEAVEQDRKTRMSGSALRTEWVRLQTIARWAEITVVPEVQGCQFNPTRASFLWLEDWHRVEFRFKATLPVGAAEMRCSGWVSFYVGPVLVGETPIAFRVSPTADPAEVERPDEPSTASNYQAIFVSYSHEDTAIVEQLERAYQVLGMSYLRDVKVLRSGEEWNPALLQKIDEADIFQLCWSKAASTSLHVKQEWQHALALGKPSFIRPLYWERPMPPRPPELEKIHFAFYQLPP